jgi:hypothetical protein
MVVHTYHPSYTGSINRMTVVQDVMGINETVFEKYLKQKRVGDVAQVV